MVTAFHEKTPSTNNQCYFYPQIAFEHTSQ